MNFKNFLEKLRALPDDRKKIILWSVVAVLAIGMGIFWIKGIINSFDKIGQTANQFNLPQVEMPEIPDITNLSPDQSQKATEGWKTYKNDQYGFEIKYPDNWFLQKTSNDSVKFSPISFDKIESYAKATAGKDLFSEESIQYLDSINNTVGLAVGNIEGAPDIITKQNCESTDQSAQKILVGGFEGCKFTVSRNWEDIILDVMIPDKKIMISFKTTDINTKNYPGIFDQMISTFKFIK
jgi:hypothetical protein